MASQIVFSCRNSTSPLHWISEIFDMSIQHHDLSFRLHSICSKSSLSPISSHGDDRPMRRRGRGAALLFFSVSVPVPIRTVSIRPLHCVFLRGRCEQAQQVHEGRVPVGSGPQGGRLSKTQKRIKSFQGQRESCRVYGGRCTRPALRRPTCRKRYSRR